MTRSDNEYDYIIIGAGSAGCALAYRLSADPRTRVLLLEAGGRDRHPVIHMPLGFALLMKHKTLNWCYQTEPERQLDNRRLSWPRGKVLGGTSAINGMVYIRGQREDFDHWRALGNRGWGYEEVLPYFKRSEHKAEGGDEFHGVDGPLWVEEVAAADRLELAELFVRAAVQTGLPRNADFNGASQEGAGFYQLNIRRGRRQSTARTFLARCEGRPNLVLATGALCQRVLLRDQRAVAVEYRRSNALVTAHARREVILCSGVINSPQLLELSGIGNPDLLAGLGIAPLVHLPGVGENLQDHLTINIQQGLHGLITFYEETRPLHMVKNLFRYLFQGRGLLAHPASQAGVFFRSDAARTRPDAQVHFAPAASEDDGKGNLRTSPGTTATVCHLRPRSRGSVHIQSSDPMVYPRIHANYLDHDHDRRALVAAVHKVREFFAAPALAPHRGREFLPGAGVVSDEDILAYIRTHAESVYHPVGTCRMGCDEMAVVDERLRVRGVAGLRVADAAIMPRITSGNTNATAIMIAEKCADMLIEDAADRQS